MYQDRLIVIRRSEMGMVCIVEFEKDQELFYIFLLYFNFGLALLLTTSQVI